MEPISFALAIGAIPGIFVSCVDCFEYVQLGKHFGKDYGICLAQLEAAEMRLLRWGEPMGLLDEYFDSNELYKKANWTEENIEKIKEWLGLILTEFEDAKKASAKYKRNTRREDDLAVPNETEELAQAGDSVRRLIVWSRKIIKHRQKNLSLGKKIKWALYRKKEFETFIENLRSLITDLVEIFPTLKPRQEELCEEEVKEVPKESMTVLVALKEEDELLNLALAKEMKMMQVRGINTFEDVVFDGGGLATLGDKVAFGSQQQGADLKFKGLRIGGTGTFHGGNTYEGPRGSAHTQGNNNTTEVQQDTKK